MVGLPESATGNLEPLVPKGTKNTYIVYIILCICIVLIGILVYFGEDIGEALGIYSPSIHTIHKRNCSELQDLYTTYGVPKDSSLRSVCTDINHCPVNLRPVTTDNGLACTQDGFTPGKNSNNEDCCVYPDPIKPDETSLGQKGLDLITSNPIMEAQIAKWVLRTLDKAVTDGLITKQMVKMKLFKPVKSIIKGTAIGGKVGEAEAAKAAKDVAKEAAQKAAADAGEEAGATVVAEAGEEVEERVTSTLIENIVKKIAEFVVEGVMARVMIMVANLSIAGIGEVVDVLMMAGMAMDAFDFAGLRQYMDNEWTYLNMRNMIEGKIITSYAGLGLNPPFTVSLNQLKKQSMDLDTDTSSSGIILNDIYTTYTEGHHSYAHKSFEDGYKKIQADPALQGEFTTSLVDAIKTETIDTFDLSDTVVKAICGLFHTDPKDRDDHMYAYLKSNLTQASILQDYILYDPKMSTDKVIGITLNTARTAGNKFISGVDLWNQFIAKKHASHVPMIVASKYYRTVASARDGTTNDPSTKGGEGNMEGQKIYTMKTNIIKNTEGVETAWPQFSYSKMSISTMCKHGMHLPAIATMLSTAADKLLCDKTGGHYTPGSCTNEEYNQNELLCRVYKGDWTLATCINTEGTCVKSNDSKCSGHVVGQGINHYSNGLGKVADIGYKSAEGAIAGAFTPLAATAYVSETLGDTDAKPGDFNVGYSDDTGICTFTPEWCERMTLDYVSDFTHTGDEVGPRTTTNTDGIQGQSYATCKEGEGQKALEMFFGKNGAAAFTHPIEELSAIIDTAENTPYTDLIKEGIRTAGHDIANVFESIF